MRRMKRRATVPVRASLGMTVALAVGTSGCGSDGTGPPGGSGGTLRIETATEHLVSLGQTTRLDARLVLASGSERPVSGARWSSSAPSVVSVDEASGVAKAESNGTARVSAAADGRTATLELSVRQEAAEVAVTATDARIPAIGLGTDAEAAVRDARGNPLARPFELSWESSDPSVATVDLDGRVTAVANGTVEIRADVEGTVGATEIVVDERVPQEEVGGIVAFVGVTVLPMDGAGALEDHTVIVRDGAIESVGPSESVAVPEGAHVVPGEGRWLLPGLADMHTHVATETSTAAMPGQLLVYLSRGVTTILGQGDFGEPLPEWATQVESGALLGPTIYTARYARDERDGTPESVWVTSPSQARSYVQQAAARGYDFMKVYNFTEADEFAAVVDEAQALGMAVIGHIPIDLGMQAALNGGLRMVAHAGSGGYLFTHFGGQPDRSRIPAAVDATLAAGAWVNPTLAVEEAITRVWGGDGAAEQAVFEQPGVRYVHPATLDLWRRKLFTQRLWNPAGSRPGDRDAALGLVLDFTRALYEAGVPLIAGADAPTVLLVPGWSLLHELRLLEQAGIPRDAVLHTATARAGAFIAEFVPGADRFGVVAPGARADLLLMEADPRTDLEHLDRRVGVMARGVWRTETWFLRRLEELARSYGR